MRIVFWIVALAAAAMATAFATSNPSMVRLDFWPLAASVEGPVYAIVFASVALGFAIGGTVASVTAVRARWAARTAARQAGAAGRELARLREAVPQPTEPPPPPLPTLPGPV